MSKSIRDILEEQAGTKAPLPPGLSEDNRPSQPTETVTKEEAKPQRVPRMIKDIYEEIYRQNEQTLKTAVEIRKLLDQIKPKG